MTDQPTDQTTADPTDDPAVPDETPSAFEFMDVLTIGELEDLEDAAGITLGQLVAELRTETYRVRTLRSLTWVMARRLDPELTLEDARAFALGDLDRLAAEVLAAAVPTDDPADGGSGRSPSSG